MLMDLGPNVYCEDFEQHFLVKAAEFYQVLPWLPKSKPERAGHIAWLTILVHSLLCW
jgi:hypothetical protein